MVSRDLKSSLKFGGTDADSFDLHKMKNWKIFL